MAAAITTTKALAMKPARILKANPAASTAVHLIVTLRLSLAFVNLIWPLLILSFGPTWPLWRLPVQTPLFDPLP